MDGASFFCFDMSGLVAGYWLLVPALRAADVAMLHYWLLQILSLLALLAFKGFKFSKCLR